MTLTRRSEASCTGDFGTKLPGDAAQLLLRLREGHARRQPREHRVRGEIARRLLREVDLRRPPDVRVAKRVGLRRQLEPEAGRQHADDLHALRVQLDRPPDDRRIAAVARLPEPMTDDRDARAARHVFLRLEVTPELRIDAEEREEMSGHRADLDDLRLRLAAEDQLLAGGDGQIASSVLLRSR